MLNCFVFVHAVLDYAHTEPIYGSKNGFEKKKCVIGKSDILGLVPWRNGFLATQSEFKAS